MKVLKSMKSILLLTNNFPNFTSAIPIFLLLRTSIVIIIKAPKISKYMHNIDEFWEDETKIKEAMRNFVYPNLVLIINLSICIKKTKVMLIKLEGATTIIFYFNIQSFKNILLATHNEKIQNLVPILYIKPSTNNNLKIYKKNNFEPP